MKESLLKKRYGIPTALLLILVFVGLVSAVVYWTGTQNLRQKIREVASGGVKTNTITLDPIDEGDSATFDSTYDGFDGALTISTVKSTESLYVSFENATDIGNFYDTYELNVIADTVPSESGMQVGKTVLTVNLSTNADSVGLDGKGDWAFDYEVSVTAGAGAVTKDTIVDAKFVFEVK